MVLTFLSILAAVVLDKILWREDHFPFLLNKGSLLVKQLAHILVLPAREGGTSVLLESQIDILPRIGRSCDTKTLIWLEVGRWALKRLTHSLKQACSQGFLLF